MQLLSSRAQSLALTLEGIVESLDIRSHSAGSGDVCAIAASRVGEGEAEVKDKVEGDDGEYEEVEEVEPLFGGLFEHDLNYRKIVFTSC